MTEWQITDDNGVIYSGNENEIWDKFIEIKNGFEEITWNGDLRLIQVHAIIN